MTKAAIERDEVKRTKYLCEVGQYRADQLVFVDESSFDKRTTHRNYGWSLRGERATKRCHFIRGRRYSKRHLVECMH
jgi:hypothetical protein